MASHERITSQILHKNLNRLQHNFLKITQLLLHQLTSDPPGAPGTPECVGTTEDSITLSWEPPTRDGGRPVTGYVVEKKEKGGRKWTK